MRRILIRTILVIVSLGLSCAAWLVWKNNLSMDIPSKTSLSRSHARTISWLRAHRQSILENDNPALWWMLDESARLSQNPDLLDMVNEYKTRELAKARNKIWRKLFDANAAVPDLLPDLGHFPDYGRFFVYALTCDSQLARDPAITQQLSVDYCDLQRLVPACVTHQLMGFLLMERHGCRDPRWENSGMAALQDRIAFQLMWDVRVIDVYLQRVLMLAATGAGDRIKPVWINRILDAQGEDGGWDNFDPLIPVGGGRYIGFTKKGAGIGRENSDFHATAQGIYLLSLLLK